MIFPSPGQPISRTVAQPHVPVSVLEPSVKQSICVLEGLVGTNGIGKSTALRVLSGNMKPNLGRFDSPPDWDEIFKFFRGNEIQNFF